MTPEQDIRARHAIARTKPPQERPGGHGDIEQLLDLLDERSREIRGLQEQRDKMREERDRHYRKRRDVEKLLATTQALFNQEEAVWRAERKKLQKVEAE